MNAKPHTAAAPAAAPAPSTAPKPQLVFFFGEKSGPSRKVEAFLSQVLQRRHNHDTFKLVRVSAEKHPDLVSHFRVCEVPTIFVVAERRVRAKVVAPKGRREIESALAPWLR